MALETRVEGRAWELRERAHAEGQQSRSSRARLTEQLSWLLFLFLLFPQVLKPLSRP